MPRNPFVIATRYVVLVLLAADSAGAIEPLPVDRFTLPNGLQCAFVHMPLARTFTAVTCLSESTASDNQDHLLWMRLMERLQTRSAGWSEGEADVSGIRLVSFDWTEEWTKALDEQTRMLTDLRFSEKQLAVYAEDTIAHTYWLGEKLRPDPEVDSQRFDMVFGYFTQAALYPPTHVSAEASMAHADLASLTAYAKKRWGLRRDSLLFMGGQVPLENVREAVKDRFASIVLPETTVPPSQPAAGTRQLTSDLKQGYLFIAWPLPELEPSQRIALAVARNLICRQIATGEEQSVDTTHRLALAGHRWFAIAIRTESPDRLEELRDLAMSVVKDLTEGSGTIEDFESVRMELLRSPYPLRPVFSSNPDIGDVKRGEREFVLDYAHAEWRAGELEPQLQEAARALTPEYVRRIAAKHLLPAHAVIRLIRPGKE